MALLLKGAKEYLLFNNTRYEEASVPTDREHHFPVKISFFSSQADLLEDPELINQLIDQAYQFSRMYWKSVSQQNLPVTIKLKWLQRYSLTSLMINCLTTEKKVYGFCKF